MVMVINGNFLFINGVLLQLIGITKKFIYVCSCSYLCGKLLNKRLNPTNEKKTTCSLILAI